MFLHDIEHHFLRVNARRSPAHRAIRWLKAFFRVYPGRISPGRSAKALTMIKRIYDAFGFPFFWHSKPATSEDEVRALFSHQGEGGENHGKKI